MTRNQIDALRLQEEKRSNRVNENIAERELPAKYISSVGTLLRGGSSVFNAGPKVGGVSYGKGFKNFVNI